VNIKMNGKDHEYDVYGKYEMIDFDQLSFGLAATI
jgi:hypothetical protein